MDEIRTFVEIPYFRESLYLRNAFLGSLDAQHHAHTTPGSRCLPTRRSVWKLAHGRGSASAAMLTRARPSPAFSTTSSSRTFSDLSISTIPPISHGSQR